MSTPKGGSLLPFREQGPSFCFLFTQWTHLISSIALARHSGLGAWRSNERFLSSQERRKRKEKKKKAVHQTCQRIHCGESLVHEQGTGGRAITIGRDLSRKDLVRKGRASVCAKTLRRTHGCKHYASVSLVFARLCAIHLMDISYHEKNRRGR